MTVGRTSETAPDQMETSDSGTSMPSHMRLVIGLLLISSFVVILNETIMSVAIPELMVELAITATAAQWLTTGFLLTMTVVIPMTGVVLQRFTTRTVFTTAMSAFTLGTLLAAVAPGFPLILAGRMVQACGTALVFPLLVTTVLTAVPAARRGRAMGLIAIVIAVAPAVGPTFAGLVLTVLPWRGLFLSVLPIAVLSLILGLLFVKNVGQTSPVRFDGLSIILSALSFGGLIYGLSSLGEGGHAVIPPPVPLVVGGGCMVAFVIRQRALQRRNTALLDMRPFGQRSFAAGAAVLVICMAVLFGNLILLPIYLQNIRGLTVLQAGLILLPGGLVMGLVAPLVGRLFDRFGPRPLAVPGTALVAVSLGLMSLYDETVSAGVVVSVHIALSIGVGLVLTPTMTSALGCLEPSLYSHGSAIVNTLQQFAGAAGTALFVTVMSSVAAAGIASETGGAAAELAGIRIAFVCGSCVAMAAVIVACFLTKPAHSGPAPVH
ncbi:DHA2 family lincomycin resistance protein-like MFS transporter [Rhodococcus rhodochrous J45]|uniref:DHA2 family lincomycin resistance protein-like MFS transporter n=2 Tax=Rhodococcus rhodochrous TaxID=1829 RepID=A0A562DGZ6_RHORH|nr:DHA2 family lincomycin resistance protein-like MFS transporter [Rhodococcus rhodochrous J45]